MSFYTKLIDNLKDNIPSQDLRLAPRSYFILGKILIVKLKPELYKHRKKIGKAILEILPYIETVVLERSIDGVKRKPKMEVIAGSKNTETIHKEHGAKFFLDVTKVMWSKGNKMEKEIMIKSVKSSEIVVDMFAGIGYFSILLAKKAKKVYSIDLNPDAIKYLKRNSFLNKVENKIEILEGDCRDFASLLENTANRIVMGHLYDTENFLPSALKIAKKGAIIHFHRNVRDGEEIKFPKQVKVLRTRKVKSYSPNVWHMVYDLKKV
ncbi:MAG: class I SAM-dependent methyltransferase family protein [Nanoarchaeota archaeon]|nr:class I SAM-dependent methyltransferase family protein [Nanoarchaeota archaeon]